jgi:hypothetical protein
VHGEYSLAEVLAKFSQLRDDRVLKSEELGWGQDKGDAQVQVCCTSQLQPMFCPRKKQCSTVY